MNRTKRPKCLTDKAQRKLAGETNFRVNNQARVDSLAKHKEKQRAKVSPPKVAPIVDSPIIDMAYQQPKKRKRVFKRRAKK